MRLGKANHLGKVRSISKSLSDGLDIERSRTLRNELGNIEAPSFGSELLIELGYG
jgi:hypothetical protein